MVDISEAMESDYVSVDVVKQSKTKTIVVIDPGQYEPDDYGNRKLTMVVNLDGKQKKWRPNKKTMQNLQGLGQDTTEWLGKPIVLSIELYNGKEMVVGMAVDVAQPAADKVDSIKSADKTIPPKTPESY